MNIMQENEKIEEGKENSLWEFVKVVIISVAIVLPIRTWIAQPFIVSGASMEPNFHDGEYLIIDELSYQFREPARGDVVVFRFPLKPREFFIKRIMGLPGETVEIKNGAVTVKRSGEKEILTLTETYIPKSFETGPDLALELKAGEYFVMGDNRSHSSDSRMWGALPKNKIMGRALVRLWPIAKAGLIE